MIAEVERASTTPIARQERAAGLVRATRAEDPQQPAPASRPCDVLVPLLRQLAGVLGAMSNAQYSQKPVGVVGGSIGEHVRHCLDHFAALVGGARTGTVAYDQRRRGTAVETQRCAAFLAIRELETALLEIGPAERTVRVRALLTADGVEVETESTLMRELIFVLSHTIHHNALIAVMCRTLGVPLPSRFGYAPATIANLERPACAPLRSSA